MRVTYSDLKNQIIPIANKTYIGYFGIYFEDLNTGAWFGINERDEFLPASLSKIPVIVAILKKVENGEISLNDIMILKKENINPYSGSLYKKGAGLLSNQLNLTF